MSVWVIPVTQPDLAALEMPDRFRTEITYFITPAGEPGVPELAAGEFFVRQAQAQQWLEDFVVEVVSPLAAEVKAEVELSEDHERWLEWMINHQLEHIRLSDTPS